MYIRVCALLVLPALLACNGKAEQGDGTGTVTLSGDALDEFGDVASALWVEVTEETEVWLLQADGRVYDQGSGAFASLRLSTAPDTCDALTALVADEGAASAALLDALGARGAGDSDLWNDHCDEVDAFVSVLEAHEGGVEAYNRLTGSPQGDPMSAPSEGTQAWTGGLAWVPTPSRPWEVWDKGNCSFENQGDDGAQAIVPQALLTVDTVEDTTVTGVIAGDVEDINGGKVGTIEATFDAVRCPISAPEDFIIVAL